VRLEDLTQEELVWLIREELPDADELGLLMKAAERREKMAFERVAKVNADYQEIAAQALEVIAAYRGRKMPSGAWNEYLRLVAKEPSLFEDMMKCTEDFVAASDMRTEVSDAFFQRKLERLTKKGE